MLRQNGHRFAGWPCSLRRFRTAGESVCWGSEVGDRLDQDEKNGCHNYTKSEKLKTPFLVLILVLDEWAIAFIVRRHKNVLCCVA